MGTKKQKVVLFNSTDKSKLTSILKAVTKMYSEEDDEVTPATGGIEEKIESNLRQWEDNGTLFRGIGKTRKDLPPGLYHILPTQTGIVFQKNNTSINDLIKFPDSSVDDVMAEINVFWNSRKKYQAFDVQYKRGILMHGPPGSGKSSIIKMLIRDVVSRGGIAINFSDTHSFSEGISILRQIHPLKPVVTIMEDIESITHREGSSLLNVLDGATNYLDNIVFVATSNYPERLEERIKDRPSRFDRVIEVGLPTDEMKKIYLTHLFKNAKIPVAKANASIKKWIPDTEGLTFPHLQELFLSVNLYDIPYETALNRLKGMSSPLSSDKHRRATIGTAMDNLMNGSSPRPVAARR